MVSLQQHVKLAAYDNMASYQLAIIGKLLQSDDMVISCPDQLYLTVVRVELH